MSFLKKAFKGVGLKDFSSMVFGYNNIGNYAKDFKDWYDGTDAMKKQARIQDEYNMKYWNLQNEYNTPAAQMERFAAAGLNPNLIYGQTNTATPIGSNHVTPPESGSSVISKAAQTIASIYGLKQMAAGIDNLKAQNSNIKKQNKLLTSQTEFVNEQRRAQYLKNLYFRNTGRLPREEGAFGAAVGDFIRYLDWLSPEPESSSSFTGGTGSSDRRGGFPARGRIYEVLEDGSRRYL